ncbi:hypothetical protein AX16_000555 [Volvariella volvacea WC 439]|nr:hypothetical protein AX16_000555 [Volvariella volvacea WC 439]
MPASYESSFTFRLSSNSMLLATPDQAPALRYDFVVSPPKEELIPMAELSPDSFDQAIVYTQSSPELSSSLFSCNSPFDFVPPSPSDLPSSPSSLVKRNSRRPPGHIPRPRNPFIIFRTEEMTKISRSIEHDHRHISRIIAHMWNKLPESDKQYWRRRADMEKLEHERKYPDYRFTPGHRSKKPVKRKVKRNSDRELKRCEEVAELLLAGKAGSELEKEVEVLDIISPTPAPERKNRRTRKTGQKVATTEQNKASPKPKEEDAPVFRSPLLPPSSLELPSQQAMDTVGSSPALSMASISYQCPLLLHEGNATFSASDYSSRQAPSMSFLNVPQFNFNFDNSASQYQSNHSTASDLLPPPFSGNLCGMSTQAFAIGSLAAQGSRDAPFGGYPELYPLVSTTWSNDGHYPVPANSLQLGSQYSQDHYSGSEYFDWNSWTGLPASAQ